MIYLIIIIFLMIIFGLFLHWIELLWKYIKK